MNPARRLAAVAALAALATGTALGTAGCDRSQPAASQPPTSKVVRLGNGKVTRIVLTPLGAARIGVRTAPASGGPAGVVIPYSALLYEPGGATAVYVNTGPLVYTRYLVTVSRIVGDQVYLRRGPPPGARVVTVGAEELLGVQNGVGEET